MSEWQPIETAPKDGTPFFWCSEYGEFCVIRWPEYEECFSEGHWRPLPDEPFPKDLMP